MRLGDSFMKGIYCWVGVAIGVGQGVLHRRHYFLRRAIGVLIAAQNNRTAGFAGRKVREWGETRGDSRTGGQTAKEVSSCYGHRAPHCAFVVDSREGCGGQSNTNLLKCRRWQHLPDCGRMTAKEKSQFVVGRTTTQFDMEC